MLAGPVDLVQGGRGFIGRFPVFVNDDRGESISGASFRRSSTWSGFTGTAACSTPSCPIDIAISGRDGKGSAGGRFFGDARPPQNNPVEADVMLPSGSWRIAAVPKGGWDQTPPNAWLLRLLILAGGALILIPTVMTGRLIDERLRNVDELRRREMELERLSRRLALALDTSQIGVWELNLDTGELYWDDRTNELFGQPEDGGPRSYMHWERAVHPDDVIRAREDFQRAVDAMGSYNSEYRLLLPDGTVRHIREAGIAYKDPAPRRAWPASTGT